MVIADAFAAAAAVVAAIPQDALTNGDPIYNTAVPTSSHVRDAAKWVLAPAATAGGAAEAPTLQAAVCKMTLAHLDAAARAAAADKVSIELGVMIALGRSAAWRMMNLSQANLNASEVAILTQGEVNMVVHADHEDEVKAALARWSPFATRFVGIAWYNAISFELHNHHHLPAKTKKLASTTISLLGMRDFFTANAASEAESLVMHDMFHPLGYDVKAKLARNTEWAQALPNLNFGNLAKRIPIKAPDCGLAFNYPELHRVASSYSQNAKDIPTELAPPADLATSLAAYSESKNATEARDATSELRAMSPSFAIASAYLAGFVLGKERRATGDNEAELSDFQARITILGSPAIKRTTGEHAGAFNLGVTKGKATVTGWGSDDKVAHTMKEIKAASAKAVAARNAVIVARTAAGARRGAVAAVTAAP